MRKFLIQISFFLLLTTAGFAYVLSFTDGESDPFYLRFTTPKQGNLILGTSKAAQALQPSIFRKILKKDFYNYSFTINMSPYGPIYLRSIKQKLDEQMKNGIFILTVDPWSISSTSKDPNDSSNFRENELALGNTPYVNMKPNYFYLIQNYERKYHHIFLPNVSDMFLHDDGWLEVTVPQDTAVGRRKKMIGYRNGILPNYQFSDLRVQYLKKMILYLKDFGEVYLVRLPIHSDMMKIEQMLMPDFDIQLEGAVDLATGYLDLTKRNNEFHYTDGVHLHSTSGFVVSEKIANWIAARPME